MAIEEIPIENAAEGNLNFTVDLDGVEYELYFKYNRRDGRWYLDIIALDGTSIRQGIKITANTLLIRYCMDEGRPLGELFCVDTRNSPTDPSLEDLGINASLMYIEQSSLV